MDETGKIPYDAPVPPSQIQAMLDAQAKNMQASAQTRVPPCVENLHILP